MTDQTQQEQAAPVDWEAIARQRERELKSVGEARHRAETELARLRAGEEDGWNPAVVPTPGQWIERWNSASPGMRLHVAERVIADAETASRCFLMGHEKRLAAAETAIAELAQAIRLTREYVGSELLPPIEGWSWYDALRRHAPHELAALDEPGPGETDTTPAGPPSPRCAHCGDPIDGPRIREWTGPATNGPGRTWHADREECAAAGMPDDTRGTEASNPAQCSGEEGFCPEHGFHRHGLKQPGEAEQVAAKVHELQTIVNRVREAVADQPAPAATRHALGQALDLERVQAERDQLATLLTVILGEFRILPGTHTATAHVETETLNRWRAALDQATTKEN